MPQTIPAAEPFLFKGGATGCLLTHGFTGTPKEMRWLGEFLAGQGHTVLGIRLAGHATQPSDMLRCRWSDWLACVEDGYNLLHSCCQRIFMLGLSMGGMLSLLYASQHPERLCGVVAMSTPYALRADARLNYIRLLSLLQPTLAKGPSDYHDPSLEAWHASYPFNPTRSIAELRELAAALQECLPRVNVPALLIHARGDNGSGSFDPDSMPKIYKALGSQHKEMLWVENSGHIITEDLDKQIVFDAASNFIMNNS